ncbi:MAG: malectin domain-containing carbohydrate-binding protein, partial [Chloroflexota bacterium]
VILIRNIIAQVCVFCLLASVPVVTNTNAQPVNEGTVLYRVNVGGPELKATDDSVLAWSQDEGFFGTEDNSPYLVANSAGRSTYSIDSVGAHPGMVDTSDPSIPASVPDELFTTERFDLASLPEQRWAFPVSTTSEIEITLLFTELFGEVSAPGGRIFDVSIEGNVPDGFDNIDQYATAGAMGAFALTHITTVTDGTLDIELLHGMAEHPALKGIQIVALDSSDDSENRQPSARIPTE